MALGLYQQELQGSPTNKKYHRAADICCGACGRCPRGFMCRKGYLNGFALSNTIRSWGKKFKNQFLGKF